MTERNEALRDHVTRTGFDLSLGKTHIAALVYVDLKLKDNRPGNTVLSKDDPQRSLGRHPAFRFHATGMHGLQDRGLVEHIIEQRRKPGERTLDMTPRRIWRITRAGRLVIDLLKETGLYQEYAALVAVSADEAAS